MKVRLERDDFQTRLHWTNDYGSFRRSHQPIQRHYSIVARRLCLLTLSLAKKYLYELMSANNANPILRRLGIKGELSGSHFKCVGRMEEERGAGSGAKEIPARHHGGAGSANGYEDTVGGYGWASVRGSSHGRVVV